ncbi:MAG: LPXTG cell wall anchor domain-containing protein [Streptococcaceae bacterium]|nr:LPXTG cell wall anchor domain-containing protein [Streptococcaceae bacterium]
MPATGDSDSATLAMEAAGFVVLASALTMVGVKRRKRA